MSLYQKIAATGALDLRLLLIISGLGFLAINPAVWAQNGSSFLEAENSTVGYTETPFRSATACADLVSLTDYDFSVISARSIAEGGTAPEHCRVSGVIAPEIGFQVNLPIAWNGRFYMYGNGGFAGTPPDAPNKERARDQALQRGFATAYTNTGHDRQREPLGTFAYNEVEKTIDYSFRAVHLTVAAAKELISAFYVREPDYSYWDGCSTGGRQGLMSAQRFPADFDGIIAGAPVLDFTGTVTSYIWNNLALKETPISSEKINLVGERLYAQCDAVDGLEDGLINDPRQCGFDPALHLPRCGAATLDSQCFTPDEINAIEKIYSGPSVEDKHLYPGQPMGAEVAGPSRGGVRSGWNGWLLNEGGPNIQLVFADTFLKYLAFEQDDPDYEWTTFDFQTDPQRMSAIAEMLNATSPDLSRFEARGGKMITYFGWADTALNPLRAIEYYEHVEETMSSAEEFYRLFMIPGMFHCGAGAGADQFDAFTPLIEWVEAGKAPERIVGAHLAERTVEFSRPHCPYPQVVQYKGSGVPEAAESFECSAPARN